MGSELAQTTFAAGANDSLAALDAYSQSTAAPPISNLTLKLPASYEELAKTIGSPPVDPTDQLSGYALANGTALTSNDMVKSVIAQDSSMHSAFAQLDSTLQKALTNVKGLVNVSMTNKGVKVNYKLASAMNIAGMSTVVNLIGGKKDLIDVLNVSGKVNFLSNVLKISAKLNIPNAYGIISVNLTDLNLLNKVTNNILGSVIGNCNVNMLGNIALSYRDGKLSLNVPNLCVKFANGFKLNANFSSKGLGSLGASLSSSFSFLNTKWNIGLTSKGKVVIRASAMLNSSSDFKRVMSASATRSRVALRNNRTIRTLPRGSTIPDHGARMGVLKHDAVDVRGNASVQFKFPTGREEHYLTDKTSGEITHTSVEPLPPSTNAADYQNFDNSMIYDPLALGHVFSTFADKSKASGMDATPLNCNAATSLKAYFPMTALNDVQTVDDVSYA